MGIGARGVVNAGVSTAINGGSFGDAFRGSVVGDMAAVGANAVGVSTDVHSLENIGGHAVIGAVAAKLQGGDAVAGAMGGATAAIVNPYLDLAIGGADGSGWGSDPETAQKWRFGTLQLASMATAATIASATGKDGMGAALAAQNETVNNWLKPKEQELKWRAGKACDAGNARGCEIGTLLNRLDASRESTSSAKFSSGFANALVLAGGSALLMPVEITKAVAEGRSVDFAIGVLKGIAGMPAHLYKGLSSDDPAMRGAAFAESMMVVAGSTAMARSFAQGFKNAQSAASNGVAVGDEAAAKVTNNFYRDGAIADTNKTMSSTGPWKSVAELTAKEVDAAIAAKLPQGTTITGSKRADDLNALSVADKYDPPYVPGTKVLEVTTTQSSSFVRVFGGDSRQTGSWVMRAEDVQGLTPQQIASKFSLPQVPTMIADVTVPAGIKLEVSAANNISPNAAKGILTGDNIGGGGVQFRVLSRPEPEVFSNWFSNPRMLK